MPRRNAKNERSQDPNVHSFDFRISRPDVGNILFIGYSGPRRLLVEYEYKIAV
jgi:hypothetical protein